MTEVGLKLRIDKWNKPLTLSFSQSKLEPLAPYELSYENIKYVIGDYYNIGVSIRQIERKGSLPYIECLRLKDEFLLAKIFNDDTIIYNCNIIPAALFYIVNTYDHKEYIYREYIEDYFN